MEQKKKYKKCNYGMAHKILQFFRREPEFCVTDS